MLNLSYGQHDFDPSRFFGPQWGVEIEKRLKRPTRHIRPGDGKCNVNFLVPKGKIEFNFYEGAQDGSNLLALSAGASEDAPLGVLVSALQDLHRAHRFGWDLLMQTPSLPGVQLLLKVGEDNHVTDQWPDLGVSEESSVGELLGLVHEFCAQFSCGQWQRNNLLGLTLVPENKRAELGFIRVSSCPSTGMADFH
jgi:hypothetical protein